MLTSQELTILLREHGYKVTPQRLAVYEAFATVYKTVEILHDINVIQVLNTGEDSFRYDANVHEHYHLRCLKCGAVEDAIMDEGIKEQLTKSVEGQSGYSISGRQFYFFGLCPHCNKMH